MANTNEKEAEVVGQDGGMIGGVRSMFNNLKTPVFWFAIGYVVCKIADRKKKKVITL